MKKWRYHSLLLRDLSVAESKLNVEGDRGWELVSVCMTDSNSARFFFKQPADQMDTVEPEEHYEGGYQQPGSFGR